VPSRSMRRKCRAGLARRISSAKFRLTGRQLRRSRSGPTRGDRSGISFISRCDQLSPIAIAVPRLSRWNEPSRKARRGCLLGRRVGYPAQDLQRMRHQLRHGGPVALCSSTGPGTACRPLSVFGAPVSIRAPRSVKLNQAQPSDQAEVSGWVVASAQQHAGKSPIRH
jgi:hypothetical protein